ncbi:MAG: tetratricopeptide repeat protein, partial [Candidatus Glassbacteria bacterium]|nr:tetratricopeptide repeat protein [Candidatus Glassbacteria bacterium]
MSRSGPKIILLVVFLVAAGSGAAATNLDKRMLGNLLQISTSLERAGRLEDAIQVLLPHYQDARVLNRLFDLYSKNGKPAEFLALAEKEYSGEPEDELLLAVYLRALGAVGLDDSLAHVGRRYIARSPQEEMRYRLVAGQLRRSGSPERALGLCLEARKVLGRPGILRRETAEVLIDLGRFDQAMDELLSYLESNPNELPVVQRQAYRILDQGEPGSSLLVERLEKALAGVSSKQYGSALLAMSVDIDLTLGRSDQSFARLRELLDGMAPGQAGGRLALFIARALKLENYALVLRAYTLADSLGLMDRGKALLEKAEIRLRMGEVEGAEGELLELAARREDKKLRVQAMRRLGEMYLEWVDRPADALRWYRELEKTGGAEDLDLGEMKLKIAQSFIRLGQLHEARSLCDNLLAAGRENPGDFARILLVKADLHFYLGEPDSASAAYSAAAKFLIGEPEANDVLERVYLIQNDKSPGAVISSRVGRALYQALCGNLQEAAGQFQETLQLAADSAYRAQLYYQMGRMYEAAGEFP